MPRPVTSRIGSKGTPLEGGIGKLENLPPRHSFAFAFSTRLIFAASETMISWRSM
jgi:hypothetical protein